MLSIGRRLSFASLSNGVRRLADPANTYRVTVLIRIGFCETDSGWFSTSANDDAKSVMDSCAHVNSAPCIWKVHTLSLSVGETNFAANGAAAFGNSCVQVTPMHIPG